MSTEGQCSASHGLEHDERLFSLPFHLWVLHLMVLVLFLGREPSSEASWGSERRVDHHRPETNVSMGKAGAQVKGCYVPALSVTSHLTNVCGRACFNDVS